MIQSNTSSYQPCQAYPCFYRFKLVISLKSDLRIYASAIKKNNAIFKMHQIEMKNKTTLVSRTWHSKRRNSCNHILQCLLFSFYQNLKIELINCAFNFQERNIFTVSAFHRCFHVNVIVKILTVKAKFSFTAFTFTFNGNLLCYLLTKEMNLWPKTQTF